MTLDMRLLLLDTCGETGSVALAEDGAVLRERSLPARAASALLLQAIREELEAQEWTLRSLDAVGVVSGPGSFTGVRVGLAAAKGLCEVTGLQLVAVSRLAVLLSAGPTVEAAVLDAGRGEFYVRWADGREELLGSGLLLERAREHRVGVAEKKLLELLKPLRLHWVDLTASDALTLVAEKLRQGAAEPVETADANYVRNARTLYAAAQNTQAQDRV